jgi:Big-like domain-containing protein
MKNRTRIQLCLVACAMAASGAGCGGCVGCSKPIPDLASSSISVDRPTGAIADGVDAVRIRVLIRDNLGRPAPGVTVQLDATGIFNTLTQPAAPTGADGVTTGTLSTTTAEPKIISASIKDGPLPSTATAEFSAGPATQLIFVQQPLGTVATAPINPPVTVAVQDQYGNAVIDWTTPITVRLTANVGTGLLSGGTAAFTRGDLASFPDLSVSTSGRYQLVATSGALAAATSEAFDILALAVSGSRFEHWVNDTGVVDRPQDLRNAAIGAWVQGGSGFRFYPGTGAADGTFVIPDVPLVPYWLCYKTDCFDTNAREVDLGFHLQGRPDLFFASPGTLQHTVLTGLVPWTNDATFGVSDDLQMFSSNVGLWFAGLPSDSVTGPVAAGATTLDQTYDYTLIQQSGYTPKLVDAAAGDRTYFNQLTTRDAGFVADGSGTPKRWNTYQAIERTSGPFPLTVTSGATTDVSSALNPVPQNKSVQVSWLIAEATPGSFGSFRTAVNPRTRADDVLHLMAIDALPDATHGFYASAADLAVMSLDDDPSAPQPDQRLQVVYGDPFPTSWARFGIGQTYFLVPYDVPRSGGGVASTYEVVFITVNDLLPSFPSAALEPGVSPVTGATIDGAPFFNDQTLASATPVIRWNLPGVGTPTFYTVEILRYSAGPTGAPSRVLAGRFATTATQLAVPPGFFVSGYHYVVQINATVQGGHDVARAPYEQQWPYDSAPALSGLLTMP